MLASALIITFLISVMTECLDDSTFPNGKFRSALFNLTFPITMAAGWYQGWNAFAPEPGQVNLHSVAILEFADGTNKIYEYPRSFADQSDLWGDFIHSKKRLMFDYKLMHPAYKQFSPCVARYIANAIFDSSNPVTKVTSYAFFSRMPEPDPAHWTYRDKLPYHLIRFVHFAYKP